MGPDRNACEQTEEEIRNKVRFLSRESLREMTEQHKKTFLKRFQTIFPFIFLWTRTYSGQGTPLLHGAREI